MRRSICVVGCFILTLTVRLEAQDRGFGIGAIIADPTGMSAKVWTPQASAIQFAMAWRTKDPFLGTRVSFSGDYIWHSFNVIRSTESLPLYYGVGGVIASGGPNQAALGFRAVFAIDWLSRTAPIDAFLQVVPVLVSSPSTDFEIGGGVGIRFYFG